MNNVFDEEVDNEIKIVLLGDGDVGKTSMIMSYISNHLPSEYSPTVFDNYLVSFIINGHRYKLSLVDTAGQVEYRSIINLALQDADAFLICFSLSNRHSLDNVENYWHPIVNQRCPKVPTILVGTKCDIEKLSKNNFVSNQEAGNVAKKIGARKLIHCSALTQKGLKQVFDYAITVAMEGGHKHQALKRNVKSLCCLN